MLKTRYRGFALPSIMIASVVMLMVLAAAISAVSTTRSALTDQYYNQVAKEAAESGIALAEACIKGGTLTWPNPLRPGTDCNGAADQCDDASCYLLSDGRVRSTFSVDSPTTPGDVSTVRSNGTVELTRTSNNAVWKVYSQDIGRIQQGDSRKMTWKHGSLVSGNGYACAIASDNKAYCWGDNWSGQLGDGTLTSRRTPVAVQQGAIPSGATIRQLTAGSYHACAIASDNKAYCWGNNGDGRLGDNTTTQRLTPVAVQQGAMPAGAMVRQISAWYNHTCAIASDNKAYCWGSNLTGQLGDNTTTQRNTPVAVLQGAMPAGAMVRQISVGNYSTCAIASNDRTYCWGTNTSGELGDNTNIQRNTPVAVLQGAMPAGAMVRQISAGDGHACAVASDNKAYCWGWNGLGQLGDGTTTLRRTPVAVQQGAIPSGATVRQVEAGANDHSCVVASNNRAYCWGWNSSGQLGDGTTTQRLTPVLVQEGAMPSGATIRQVSASWNTCAVASDNKAYCWGSNSWDSSLGNGSTENSALPVLVKENEDATTAPLADARVFLGPSSSCAVASDNKAYCWGSNANGQLGDNTTTQRNTPVAVQQGAMPSGATIRQIAMGSNHTCALASDNKVYCWGYNGSGQLGDNTTTQRNTPVAVQQGAMPSGATIRQIAAGGSQTCAIASDNKAYCWGDNMVGQLGDNTTTQRNTPVAVQQGAMPSGATIRQIVTGSYHTCAIASDNKAYCWGGRGNGRLGDGSGMGSQPTPVAVQQGAMPSGATIRQIVVSASSSCALASDNKAYCWGFNNTYGQVGDNTTTDRSTPVAVLQGAMPAGTTIRQLAEGGYYLTCAIASNNKAYCWGDNTYGQLGDNTTTQRNTPVAVQQGAMPSGATMQHIAVGGYHACTVASDNKTYCWGRNNNGQLGDNTTTQRNTPVAIRPLPDYPIVEYRQLFY